MMLLAKTGFMSTGLNVGHGHIFPRPDGHRAKCGGSAICPECKKDMARKAADESNCHGLADEFMALDGAAKSHLSTLFGVAQEAVAAQALGVDKETFLEVCQAAWDLSDKKSQEGIATFVAKMLDFASKTPK